MSENYYLKLPPNQDVKSALDTLNSLALMSESLPRSKLVQSKISALKELIFPKQGIHIGKYVSGYRFMFSSSIYKSFDEWMAILKAHPDKIVSESDYSVSL